MQVFTTSWVCVRDVFVGVKYKTGIKTLWPQAFHQLAQSLMLKGLLRQQHVSSFFFARISLLITGVYVCLKVQDNVGAVGSLHSLIAQCPLFEWQVGVSVVNE